MNITQVGVDLAKAVFQVHGIDARGKVGLRKQLKTIAGDCIFYPAAAVSDWDGGLRQARISGRASSRSLGTR